MLMKISRTRAFNCVFHLKKPGQDPLNTSSLFIKIWIRIIIWPICTKNNRKGAALCSPPKRQPGIPAEPRGSSQTHSDLMGWTTLRLSPPRAILCKGTSCTDKGRETHWACCYSKDWLVKHMDAAQLLETSSGAGGSWRESTSGSASQAFVPSPCNKFTFSPFSGNFFPLQIHFSRTWWEHLWMGLGKIGHGEIIIEFLVLVQSFLYIFLGYPSKAV